MQLQFLSLFSCLSIILSLEYAILYDDNLYEQATSISNLYNSQVEDDFKLNTETFSNTYIEQNYTGNTYSEKIKDFINHLENTYNELKYILILGDEISFPPIYTSNDIPSDDFYFQAINQLNLPPQISIGRIPSSNIEQINNFVTKLTSFLLNPTIGSWRDTAMLIADDEYKNGENEACEIKHTLNSNIIYNILSPYMNVKTFYGVEYNSVTTSDGLYHNELNEDIINQINQGVALINYIGHGDQRSLSAEKIIDMERDMSQLSVDSNKLGIWVVGTCKFGQYDNEACMAEELITNEDASIGVISTVRSVSSNYNIDFLDFMFTSYVNHFSNSDILRLGDIVKEAKNNSYNNNPNFYQGYLFHLFGDPALPIFSSKQQDLSQFTPNSIDIGEIYNIDMNNYNLGSLEISFNDYEIGPFYYGEPTASCNGELNYTVPGSNIFKDSFLENSCYIIPIDAISCSDCTSRMQLYYQNEGMYNGISYIKENVEIDANDPILISDNTGPEITFSNANYNLYNNSTISANSEITVNITDSSGVNIYDGIGHNMRYWFNDEVESYQINSNEFYYNDACSGSGNLKITIPQEYLGQNTFYFEAWDNYNNRTLESIELDILNKNRTDKLISNFLNLPNPFKNNTHLTFQVHDVSNLPIDLKIKIFDLDGKILKNMEFYNINQNFNSITWDGQDNLNRELPNGTYLMYATFSSYDKEQSIKHILTKVK